MAKRHFPMPFRRAQKSAGVPASMMTPERFEQTADALASAAAMLKEAAAQWRASTAPGDYARATAHLAVLSAIIRASSALRPFAGQRDTVNESEA